jgi:hypothetical protein
LDLPLDLPARAPRPRAVLRPRRPRRSTLPRPWPQTGVRSALHAHGALTTLCERGGLGSESAPQRVPGPYGGTESRPCFFFRRMSRPLQAFQQRKAREGEALSAASARAAAAQESERLAAGALRASVDECAPVLATVRCEGRSILSRSRSLSRHLSISRSLSSSLSRFLSLSLSVHRQHLSHGGGILFYRSGEYLRMAPCAPKRQFYDQQLVRSFTPPASRA